MQPCSRVCRAFAAVLLAVGGPALPATSDHPPALAIHVQGNQLVDGAGKAVQLRGVNVDGLGGSLQVGWTGNIDPWAWGNLGTSGGKNGKVGKLPDFAAIALWKVNAVRFPLNEASVLGYVTEAADGTQRPADPEGNYMPTLIASVAAANAAGLYVILDLHINAPGHRWASVQNPFLDADNSIAFWTKMANTFKNNPGVLFELFNEPYLSPTGSDPTGSLVAGLNPNKVIRDGAVDGATVYYELEAPTGKRVPRPLKWSVVGYNAVIAAVRATGATNVIILGGQGYDNDLTWWQEFPPTDPLHQLALAYHAYPSTWGRDLTGASRQFTAAQSIDMLTAPGVPVILTEFGGPVGPGADTTFANNILRLVDQRHFSVLAWTWNPWNGDRVGANTVIQNITSYTPTEGLGRVYQSWLANHP